MLTYGYASFIPPISCVRIPRVQLACGRTSNSYKKLSGRVRRTYDDWQIHWLWLISASFYSGPSIMMTNPRWLSMIVFSFMSAFRPEYAQSVTTTDLGSSRHKLQLLRLSSLSSHQAATISVESERKRYNVRHSAMQCAL
jgi:hypothetical protein